MQMASCNLSNLFNSSQSIIQDIRQSFLKGRCDSAPVCRLKCPAGFTQQFQCFYFVTFLFGLFAECKQFPEHIPPCLPAVFNKQVFDVAIDVLNKCLNFWGMQQPVCCGADIPVIAAVCGIGIPVGLLLGFSIEYPSDEHKLLCAWRTRLPGYPRIAFYCTNCYTNIAPVFHNVILVELFAWVNLMVEFTYERLPLLHPTA